MGEFIDFCLGPAPAVHREDQGLQAQAEPVPVVLEGQGRQPGDAAHLRVRLLHPGGARRSTSSKLEEAKRRDHRKLGRELDLFSDRRTRRAPGSSSGTPRAASSASRSRTTGATSTCAGGYDIVFCPAHREARPLEDQRAHRVLQGQHVLAHRDRGRRVPAQADELPVPHHDLQARTCAATASCRLRFAELGTVYRFERSGVLHGLMRVRGFTQDDAHLFCRPDQLEAEIVRVLDFVTSMLRTFGFEDYDIYLSTKPEKAGGHATSSGRSPTARPASARWRRAACPTQVDPGRGRLLRPQDRHQDQGLAGPRLAVLDHPGGLQQPEPLRPRVHRRGRQGRTSRS